MASSSRWGYTGLLIGVSMAAGIWGLHQGGLLAAWDGVFYDRFLSWTARFHRTEPNVLILRGGQANLKSETEAVKILDTLDGLGARVIVFNSPPLQSAPTFYEKAAGLGNVVFGRRLRPDPTDPDTLKVEEWPSCASHLDLPWGVTTLPPGLRGIHRSQRTRVRVGEDILPTMEMRTAELCESGTARFTKGDHFLINFVGSPGSIPNVSVATASAGDLIAELVDGKVVLVGTMDELVGLQTPVGREEPMSFVEFQGNALQTLLTGTPIRLLSELWILALLVGLGVLSSQVYQRVNSVAGVRLVLGVLLGCGVGAALALDLLHVWLPMGSVVLAQVGQFGLTLVFRTRMTNRALNEMRLHVLNQIKERFCPDDIWLSAEYWDHVVSLIHQTLDVRRMVFLQRMPGSRTLNEIRTVNCSLEDLNEQDRQLDSPAFALALSKGVPCRADGILKQDAAPEVDYVCPLSFDGEVMGVWVVGMDAEKTAGLPDVDRVLDKFSRQLGRLLFHRNRRNPSPSILVRLKEWVSAEKDDQAYRELRSTADMLERYYNVLEAVLGQIGTAMIVYDYFGRVLKANHLATELLRAEGSVPTQVTALAFLELVTGINEPQARDILRSVLLENSPAAMPAKLASQGDRQFLLRLYPLPERHYGFPGRKSVGACGIICELIETTSLSNLASLKGVVADRLGVELRDHLAAIEMSAALLETASFSEAKRKFFLNAVHQKINTCVEVINECQKYLGRSVDAYSIDCFPLDALDILDRVCAAFTLKAADRKVTLQVARPRLMEHVMASTTELEQLLFALLSLLLSDAAENTAITITVEDATNRSIFRFSNCGFGIPNNRLQQVLSGPESPMSEEFRALRDSVGSVEHWAGHFEITSEVGKGYSVVLELRQFRLSSLFAERPA
jgi:CHASE2 domain-containing sensor protein